MCLGINYRVLEVNLFLLMFQSLSSNVAFGLGASYLSLYEEQGTGIGWGDIWQSPLVNDTFCLAYVMFMLMLDALIYFILTWYIEAVFPGIEFLPVVTY